MQLYSSKKLKKKKIKSFRRNFLAFQWSGLGSFPAKGLGSVSGQGIKILQAAQCGRSWGGGWSLVEEFSCCCSVAQLCLTLCDPMDCSTPGFPVLHHLLEIAQTNVHWVGDAIHPSCSLSSPSPPAFNLSQHQGLFQWISSSHQVAKVLELQHQSFQSSKSSGDFAELGL